MVVELPRISRIKFGEMFFIGNDKSKGSGLGLFITKKAVEALKR